MAPLLVDPFGYRWHSFVAFDAARDEDGCLTDDGSVVVVRKRGAEFDYLCMRCGCPCDPPGERPVHIGGGQGMKACGPVAVPVLRSEFEAQMADDVESGLSGLPWRKNG